jgi:hypothetical protein
MGGQMDPEHEERSKRAPVELRGGEKTVKEDERRVGRVWLLGGETDSDSEVFGDFDELGCHCG